MPWNLFPVSSVLKMNLSSRLYEYRLEGRGKRPTFRALAYRDPDVIAGTTHELGYRLGDNIYRNLVNGKLRRIQLKELFGTSLRGAGKSREVWFDWTRLSHDPESDSSPSSGNSRRG